LKLVVHISGSIEKALNTAKLVKKPVMVTRGGQTFRQMKWMRPGDDAPAQRRHAAPEDQARGGRYPDESKGHMTEGVKRLLSPEYQKRIDKSKLVQPSGDVDELYKLAEDARAGFKASMEKAAELLGAVELMSRPVLKSRERISQKIKGDGAKDASQIYDIDGHTLIFDDIEGVAKALDFFMKDPRVIRIKNNYANPTALGYRDINMNVKLPNGMISEVQINTRAMVEAKEGAGHVFYELSREAEGGMPPPPPPKPYDVAVEAQRNIYSFAWELSRDQRPQDAASLKASILEIALPFWSKSMRFLGDSSTWLSEKTKNTFQDFGSKANGMSSTSNSSKESSKTDIGGPSKPKYNVAQNSVQGQKRLFVRNPAQ